MSSPGCEKYREEIVRMVDKIKNPAFLKRIYQLAEYLYIRKQGKE